MSRFLGLTALFPVDPVLTASSRAGHNSVALTRRVSLVARSSHLALAARVRETVVGKQIACDLCLAHARLSGRGVPDRELRSGKPRPGQKANAGECAYTDGIVVHVPARAAEKFPAEPPFISLFNEAGLGVPLASALHDPCKGSLQSDRGV